MTQNTEIKYDDLEYLSEGLFLFNGQPFTGVTIDRNERGVKISEVPFVDGREHGMARSWHANGRLSMEGLYVHGESRGLVKEWFEDGSLKSETVWEFGVPMRWEKRDRSGNVIEVFERQSTDVLYQNVVKRRAAQA
jgi:antitoxin component YwqK of YwqJK toxin-antitoxin module